MDKLRIGGVPEHFNYIWKKMESSTEDFQALGFSWHEYHGGTGAMMKDLSEGHLDIALVLTEGAIAGISNGVPVKIAGTFVESPLTWGVHVPADCAYQKVDDLKNASFGISRPFSGSHLMTCFMANDMGWDWKGLNFETVGSLEGARLAFNEQKADAFLWEKFTTKHLVESGEWRRVGEYRPEWPAFVFVARQELTTKKADVLQKLIRKASEEMNKINEGERNSFISKTYSLSIEDIEKWAAGTRWKCQTQVRFDYLERVLEIYASLNLIKNKFFRNFYVADFCLCV